MSRTGVVGLDHVHVYVRDRSAAARWYGAVLGFRRDPRFAVWGREVGGPLTLTADDRSTHLALFEDEKRAGRGSTVALRMEGSAFVAFARRTSKVPLYDRRRIPAEARFQDHELSLSLYFNDLDGNPLEVTTYDVQHARLRLRKV